MKRFYVMAMVALFVVLGALPAFATTTAFDPAGEVTSFLGDMIATGWPIFLAIIGGLMAITLASGGIRSVFRKLAGLFTRSG